MLTIEEMLAAKDRKVEEVPVPEWGGSVCVRRLSALEAIEFYVQLKGIAGTEVEVAKARMVSALSSFLSDADGNPVCSVEQAQQLTGKSSAVVHQIVSKGHEINATEDKKVKDIAKNSAPSLDATSPSA
jgi:hypothetical protein